MQQPEPLNTDVTDQSLPDEINFSLVLGGPLYQLYLRSRLALPALELVVRRAVFMSLICWLPLLLLALMEGHGFGGVSLPFSRDIGVHIRFLARSRYWSARSIGRTNGSPPRFDSLFSGGS
jgi:hypothetical protein